MPQLISPPYNWVCDYVEYSPLAFEHLGRFFFLLQTFLPEKSGGRSVTVCSWIRILCMSPERSMVSFVSSVLFSRMHNMGRRAYPCQAHPTWKARVLLPQDAEEGKALLLGGHWILSQGPSHSLWLMFVNTSLPFVKFRLALGNWYYWTEWGNLVPLRADDGTTHQASHGRILPNVFHLSNVCYSIAPGFFQRSSHAPGHSSPRTRILTSSSSLSLQISFFLFLPLLETPHSFSWIGFV